MFLVVTALEAGNDLKTFAYGLPYYWRREFSKYLNVVGAHVPLTSNKT